MTTALAHVEAILVELRTHMDTRFDEADKRYDQRFSAQQEAITERTLSLEKRLESMNQIREQLNTQARTFLTKAEYEGRHQALVEKLEADRSRLDKLEARRMGWADGWGWFVGIVGAIVAVSALAYEILKGRGQQ